MSKLAIFIADGCEEIEALTVVDIVRRGKIDIDTVAIGNTTEVTSSHRVTFICDKVISDFNSDEYDGVILDIMMPKMDGLEVLKTIRKQGNTVPVLLLTAKSEIDDKVRGLDLGANDYLTKPFESRELIACVHALTRRQKDQVDEITFGDLRLDLAGVSLYCGAESIRLSSKEFDVMRLLMQAGSGNIPKSRILDQVWGYDSEAIENNVEVYVAFLRKKLKNLGSSVSINSVRGVGYHLEA